MRLIYQVTTSLLLMTTSLFGELEEGFSPLFDGKTLNGWTAARSSDNGDTGAYSVNEEEQAIHVYAGQEAKKVWPLSLEMQIGESAGDKPHAKGSAGRFHSGDLFVLGKNLTTVTSKEGKYYSPKGQQVRGKSVHTKLGTEKPGWNEIEIQVYGSEKAIFILNGEVVLETYNFTQKDKNGQTIPLAKGHIGLQAEWAEILYRNIRIKELPSD